VATIIDNDLSFYRASETRLMGGRQNPLSGDFDIGSFNFIGN
jgi:hypothetical protein